MIRTPDVLVITQKPNSCSVDQITQRNVYEFDLSLWCLLKDLADQQPEIASRQFQISLGAVKHIAQVDFAILHKLASQELCSFQLNTPEETLLTHLAQPYALTPLHSHSFKEMFVVLYWFMVNQIASHDVDLACLYFGISSRLAIAIMHANYNQLIQLANTIPLQFSLCCSEQSVLDCLSSNDSYAPLKKLFTILDRRLK